jgi:putative transposase
MAMKYKLYHPPHLYLDNTEYFITAATLNRQPLFKSDERKVILRDMLREKVKQYRIRLFAWVILDEHYHLLMRTAEKESLYRFLKSLHGESAIRLNKEDGCQGRQVWYNYWDYCPRSEKDFYIYFNYIHINPAKHGYVRIGERIARIEGNEWVLVADSGGDLHDALMKYPFSSYPYYANKYGKAAMTDLWFDYPLVAHLEGDDF